MLGSLNGNFESAFKKLATLHAKQDFSFAIITGNLFGVEKDEDSLSRLLNGQISVPLSTYFTVGTNPLPEQVIELVEKGEDVCPALIMPCLMKRGLALCLSANRSYPSRFARTFTFSGNAVSQRPQTAFVLWHSAASSTKP